MWLNFDQGTLKNMKAVTGRYKPRATSVATTEPLRSAPSSTKPNTALASRLKINTSALVTLNTLLPSCETLTLSHRYHRPPTNTSNPPRLRRTPSTLAGKTGLTSGYANTLTTTTTTERMNPQSISSCETRREAPHFASSLEVARLVTIVRPTTPATPTSLP